MWLQVLSVLVTVASSGALRAGLETYHGKHLKLSVTKLNPLNYYCNPRTTDTPENLKDYVSFFDSAWGKRVRTGGDSLMLQQYQVISCAARILRYYNTEWEGNLIVKRSADAPDHTAFHLDNSIFFSVSGLPGPGLGSIGQGKNALTWDAILPAGYDFFVFNAGHYIYTEPATFAQHADALFAGLKKRANDTASRVVLVDHPPQHFNTETGAFFHPGVGDEGGIREEVIRNCSCAQPNFLRQDAKVNNELAATLAQKHGFDHVALWDDMNFCGEHPYDCTHFTLSPTIFKAAVQGLQKILAR